MQISPEDAILIISEWIDSATELLLIFSSAPAFSFGIPCVISSLDRDRCFVIVAEARTRQAIGNLNFQDIPIYFNAPLIPDSPPARKALLFQGRFAIALAEPAEGAAPFIQE